MKSGFLGNSISTAVPSRPQFRRALTHGFVAGREKPVLEFRCKLSRRCVFSLLLPLPRTDGLFWRFCTSGCGFSPRVFIESVECLPFRFSALPLRVVYFGCYVWLWHHISLLLVIFWWTPHWDWSLLWITFLMHGTRSGLGFESMYPIHLSTAVIRWYFSYFT